MERYQPVVPRVQAQRLAGHLLDSKQPPPSQKTGIQQDILNSKQPQSSTKTCVSEDLSKSEQARPLQNKQDISHSGLQPSEKTDIQQATAGSSEVESMMEPLVSLAEKPMSVKNEAIVTLTRSDAVYVAEPMQDGRQEQQRKKDALRLAILLTFVNHHFLWTLIISVYRMHRLHNAAYRDQRSHSMVCHPVSLSCNSAM